MKGNEHAFSPTRLFKHGDLTLEYATTSDDESKECVLCFHGFGRIYTDFEVFFPLLSPSQRMVSIQLFGHAKSTIPQHRVYSSPLVPEELGNFFLAFINHIKAGSFHILAYSMGGRVAMTIANCIPDRVLSLLLIASDGLKKNWLYSFASNTALGRALSSYTIHHPKWLFVSADFLARIRVLSPKLHRFVYVHLDSLEKRRLVFTVWLFHRRIFPDLMDLGRWTERQGVRVYLVFGKYDEVIPTKLGLGLQKRWGRERLVYVIPSGHRLLTPELVDFVSKNGLWPSTINESQ